MFCKMAKLASIIFVCVLTRVLSFPVKKDYTGYQVWTLVPRTDKQLHYLVDFQHDGDVDLWTSFSGIGNPVDIMISPDSMTDKTSSMMKTMQHSVKISDVQRLIDSQTEASAGKLTKQLNWEEYHRHDVIANWLVERAQLYPDIAKVHSIGQSHEQHDMKLLEIGKHNGRRKPIIWVDATIHAREWIAPATCTYFIKQLTELYGTDDEVTKLVDTIDWHILPVVNPDGYEYSHTNDRLWRKTRTRYPGSPCYGTDANRNFDFHWMEVGASSNPCSITYAGPEAFSEIETRNIRDWIEPRQEDIETFITMHSYGQLYMSPYGYTKTLPDDFDELYNLGLEATNALTAVFGTPYRVGAASQILYESSGTSRDWAKGVPNIKWVYTIELRDTGSYGFLLPPEQIRPTAEETWELLKVMGNRVLADLAD